MFKNIFFKQKIFLGALLTLFAAGMFFLPPIANAQANTSCLVYFHGVGCPHCGKVDPVLFGKIKDEHPNLVIIEYEIYQQQENGQVLYQYNGKYGSGLGVPLAIFDSQPSLKGDRPILDNIEGRLESESISYCPLIDGQSVDFNQLDINELPGFPNIWYGNKVLVKREENQLDSEFLRDLLFKDDLEQVLSGHNFKKVNPVDLLFTGHRVSFSQAVDVGGWLLEWNGKPLELTVSNMKDNSSENGAVPKKAGATNKLPEFTWAKIASLAAVDAINPCALAVLILMLTAILAYNPDKRRNIILAGLAFIISVFVMYLVYGLIIIKFFQIVQALTSVRLWLYKVLGVVAVILGILNIKDFIKYKPGTLATEMPLFLRPKVKKLISGVTSPRGAFGTGIFVTLFLLPCTIGPYVIAGGILSIRSILYALPPLLLYNFIFVFPMLVIVGIVYFGFRQVGNISDWKEANITKIHLFAGVIMLVLGIAMIFGWV